MVESHIQVVLSCDKCGKELLFEEYDETTTDAAETKWLSRSGWVEDQTGHLVCHDCAVEDRLQESEKENQ